jgi:glutamate 5-kinase
MKYKRVVIKVGTSLFAGESSYFDTHHISHITEEIAKIKERGCEVTLVSSGAIGAGMERLGLRCYPSSIPERQATASVGQSHLMHTYEKLFSAHNQKVAQVLLTHRELSNRRSYLNILNTFHRLFGFGVIPIVNENDAVATEELQEPLFSDNDTLAAHISTLIDADLLVILTDEDGLYRFDKDGKNRELISVVPEITKEIEGYVRDRKGRVTKGGMSAKIKAARLTTETGITTIIANGKKRGIVLKAVAGKEIGTRFLPKKRELSSRKRWLIFNLTEKGEIVIDEGAKRALILSKKSLLPSGIVRVSGRFREGDGVIIKDADGNRIAKGVSSYSADDIEKIAGLHSAKIEKVLGYKLQDEVVHRDNMAILI